MKQSDILIKPYVTEKSLNLMAGTPKQKFKDGKHAIIQLAEGYSAEDVGMRVGVF